jgi:hypothetical protein
MQWVCNFSWYQLLIILGSGGGFLLVCDFGCILKVIACYACDSWYGFEELTAIVLINIENKFYF